LHDDSIHDHRKTIRTKRDAQDCTDDYIEVINKIDLRKDNHEKLIDLLAKMVEDRNCINFNDTSFASVKKKYREMILLLKKILSNS